MKKTLQTIITFILLLGAAQFCSAQSGQNWKTLSFPAGTATFNGVEGYYQLTTCNGAPILLLKFVNNNSYSLRAGWRDMIVTKSNSQISGGNLQDSITIAANSTVMGDCNGATPQLFIKMSYFPISDINDFNYFIALDFGFKKTN